MLWVIYGYSVAFAPDKTHGLFGNLSIRFLHNETAHAIQRRLQFSGLQSVVLPIRVTEKEMHAATA